MAQSLAAKYRPQRYDQLIGQQPQSAILRTLLMKNQLPQTILLSGPSGLGKTTTARILARAVVCEHPTEGQACENCNMCALSANKNFSDIIELDAASNGGVTEIRQLKAASSYAPMLAAKKVYIIDEAHNVTKAGNEAFLKLIEDTPDHVMFVFATTEPENLPPTVVGRMLHLPMRRPTTLELEANLKRVATAEGLTLSAGLASAIVAATRQDLGVRGTLSSLEQVSALLGGNTVNDEAAYAALGAVAPNRVDELWAAITEGKAGTVFDILHENASSEKTLARLLAAKAEVVLRKAAYAADADPLRRYSRLLAVLLQHQSQSGLAPALLETMAASATPEDEPSMSDKLTKLVKLNFPDLHTALTQAGVVFDNTDELYELEVVGTAAGLQSIKTGKPGSQLTQAIKRLNITLTPKIKE